MVPIRFAFLRVPLLLQLLIQALSDFPTVLYKDDPLEKVHARSKVVPSGREFFFRQHGVHGIAMAWTNPDEKI